MKYRVYSRTMQRFLDDLIFDQEKNRYFTTWKAVGDQNGSLFELKPAYDFVVFYQGNADHELILVPEVCTINFIELNYLFPECLKMTDG